TKKMHDAGYTIHDKENPTAYIMDRESCIVSRVSWIMYLASFFSVVLAMKTKETAFTLPIIIALYEFSFFGKSKTRELPTANSRRFFYLLPFLFTLMVIPLDILGPEAGVYRQEGNYGEETRQLQLKEATTLSSYAYLLIQFRVIVTYIRLLLLPINQNLDYDYPVYNSFLNPTVFSSFLFLLSIFGLGIYLFYRSRVTMHDARYMIHDEQSTMHASRITHHALRFIAFGILWFFITLSVESSIIPIKDVIFEHRLYLPSIGFIIALSTALSLVLHRSKSATVRSATGRIRRGEQNDSTSKQNSSFSFLSAGLPLYGSVALIVLLSIATFQRNTVWQDKISLWEDTVKKSPGNPLVHFRLATAYLFKGQIDKAIEQHRITVKLWPDCALNYYFLGNAYEKKGLVNKAIEQYLIAVQLKPDFTDAHLRLQKAYIGNGLNR
ncbi:MAG: hypothetical protein HY754_16120, partial [Nitrospirae bacterium]|nr:hypothetical protein [Nitrospirota bacterium]